MFSILGISVVLWHLRFIFLSVWSPNPPQWYHAQWNGSCDSVPSYDAMHTLSEQHLSLHSMHIESEWLMITRVCPLDGFHYFTTIGCQVFRGYCPLLSGQTRLNQKQGDSISSIFVKIRLPRTLKGLQLCIKAEWRYCKLYYFCCFLRKFQYYFQQTLIWNLAHLNDLRSVAPVWPCRHLDEQMQGHGQGRPFKMIHLAQKALTTSQSQNNARRLGEKTKLMAFNKTLGQREELFPHPAGPFAW